MNPKKCLEDFEEGFVFEFQVPGLTIEEITGFAAKYDPQRFHLDEIEATKTHFGGLVASGFQTQLLCFRPFCEHVLRKTWAVGAPGIESLKWLRPWYPGEALNVTVTLVGKRLSSKRNDRGYLGFEMRAEADGMPTFAMDWTIIMLTQEGVAESSES
jgi:acyl dehydratase